MKTDKTSTKPVLISSFKHSFDVKVYLPIFEPLTSIKALDVKLLSKGKHRIEIGRMSGGCCKKTVYANINKGVVVAIEADECKDNKKEASKEIKDLFEYILKLPELQDSWIPVPVEEFVMMAQTGSYPPRAGTGAGCFYVCFWKYCVFCCKSTATSNGPKCWGERRKPDVIMGV